MANSSRTKLIPLSQAADRLAAAGASPQPPAAPAPLASPPAALAPAAPPPSTKPDPWGVRIVALSYAPGSPMATPADVFGLLIPGRGNLSRVKKMAAWFRSQHNAPHSWIDAQMGQIEFGAMSARREGSAAAQDFQNEMLCRFEEELEVKIRFWIHASPKERENLRTLSASPPPPPPAAVPRKAMTAEDAASVSSTIYSLSRHGVAFCVDPASGLLKYYDPRNIASPEDCEVLRAFAGEARRVIVEGYNLNQRSIPEGDRTRTIFPHHAEAPA